MSIKESLLLKKSGNAIHFNKYASTHKIARTEPETSEKGPNVTQLLCASLKKAFKSILGLSEYTFL